MKKICFVLVLCFSIQCSFVNYVNVLPKYPFTKWFSPNNKVGLVNLINKNNPTIIVEVGSWLGASTIFMAKNSSSQTKILAVDTWDPSYALDMDNEPEAMSVTKNAYHYFLSNIILEGVSDKIIPCRMSSEEASKILNVKADLIYIDADHSEESVYFDLVTWHDKLSEKGVICGDDYDAPSVRKAVDKFAIELGKTVESKGSFYWIV